MSYRSKTPSSSITQVKSIATVKDAIKNLQGRTLYVWDFDNVIAWLGEEIFVGTDPWFLKHLNACQEQSVDFSTAEKFTLDISKYIHDNTPILAVEHELIEFVKELQGNEQCVITLTSRSGKYLKELTRAQANELGICFNNSQRFSSRSANLTHVGPHCHVEDGYFFGGGKNKGEVLQAALEALGYSIADYDNVVFIDDDQMKVEQVQNIVVIHTNFVGFRYGYLDDHLQEQRECDLKLSHLQYYIHQKTGKFITRKEAKKILSEQEDFALDLNARAKL